MSHARGPHRFENVLSLRTESDPVLSVIAPLGLAAAASRPCLVIDLDQDGPNYPGRRSLADLAREGPSRLELMPSLERRHSRGVALLRNGDASWEETSEIVHALSRQWPAVVLRLPTRGNRLEYPGRVVPVIPLFPGVLAPPNRRAGVWQSFGPTRSGPGPGPVLPPLSRAATTKLLTAQWEPRGRWVRAWRTVWELPWP